jgi:hypothetical protein
MLYKPLAPTSHDCSSASRTCCSIGDADCVVDGAAPGCVLISHSRSGDHLAGTPSRPGSSPGWAGGPGRPRGRTRNVATGDTSRSVLSGGTADGRPKIENAAIGASMPIVGAGSPIKKGWAGGPGRPRGHTRNVATGDTSRSVLSGGTADGRPKTSVAHSPAKITREQMNATRL